MRKLILFITTLTKEITGNDIISLANDLTYKLILAIFPLIIFLLSVLGYFELDLSPLMAKLWAVAPAELWGIFRVFVSEVLEVKRPSLLSTSLFFTVISASSGFKSVIRGINKAYGVKDSRNIAHKTLISVALVFLFALIIILSLVMLIFNNKIYVLLNKYFAGADFVQYLFGILGYFTAIGIMILGVIVINGLALNKRAGFKNLLPGSLFTVLIWLLASRLFNIYVNNFSSYSAVYGSVAGIMILMIWLNIICGVLLIGSQINALLEVV